MIMDDSDLLVRGPATLVDVLSVRFVGNLAKGSPQHQPVINIGVVHSIAIDNNNGLHNYHYEHMFHGFLAPKIIHLGRGWGAEKGTLARFPGPGERPHRLR